MSGQTIVVFGGAGFIGTHLLNGFSRSADNRLFSVDIKPPKTPVEGVTYIIGDIRDLSSLEITENIDVIYNLAAVHTTPGHQTHEYYETNIHGATEVTAFARRKSVRTILFTSSISVYGPSEETKSETTPPAPESSYGWSKWLAEGIHRSWLRESSDRQLVICRPAVIFGRAEGGNFTRLAKLLRKGLFVYPGRKDTIKACFYVEDLIAAIQYALSLNQPYVLFNGCYPDRYTLEDIVETLRVSHFPRSRILLIPKWVVTGAAAGLRPFSVAGLGIHPDRVKKLVRSTDIVPGWLSAQGLSEKGQLSSAIERWQISTHGAFD